MRILLAEQAQPVDNTITKGLTQMGFVVDLINDGDHARQALLTEAFDVAILDLNVSELSALFLLKNIRQASITTPIIILSTHTSIDSIVKYLDNGADDCLTKPVDLNELGARIRALIRRAQDRTLPIIHYRNLTLDPAAHEVKVNGKHVNLSRREFALLHILLESPGVLLTREHLMQRLYGWEADIDSNTLEVYVHHLRKKLNANYIHTLRGLGYRVNKI